MKLWSKGEGAKRDLVVIYYLGEQGDLKERVARAAGNAIVLNDTRQPTKVYTSMATMETLSQTRAQAERVTGADVGRIILVGFSAGCQALRTLLLAGAQPDAIVAIDGTHSSSPPMGWQIDTWSKYANAARRGERVMVATHTMIVPPTYSSTKATLQAITGFDLTDPGFHSDGNLHVWGYAGNDQAAHINQARQVLPEALQFALSRLGPIDSSEVEPVPDTAPAWKDPTKTLGERAMLWTLDQMDLPEAEEKPHGSNAGPYVAELLAPCVRNGKPLGIKAGNYCCGGSSAAMTAALIPGEDGPHGYRAGVVEAVADSGERFVPAAAVLDGTYALEYGDELIWDRSVPGRPETSWWRHINRFEGLEGQKLTCLDFNAGADRCITRTTRSVHDRFLGVIPNGQRMDTVKVAPALTQLELDNARRLMAIADDVMSGRYGMRALEESLAWRA